MKDEYPSTLKFEERSWPFDQGWNIKCMKCDVRTPRSEQHPHPHIGFTRRKRQVASNKKKHAKSHRRETPVTVV